MSNDSQEEFDPRRWTVKELVKDHNRQLESQNARLKEIEGKLDQIIQSETIRATREEEAAKMADKKISKATGVIGVVVVAIEVAFQTLKEFISK